MQLYYSCYFTSAEDRFPWSDGLRATAWATRESNSDSLECSGEMRLSQPQLIKSNPVTNQHWLRAPSAVVNNSVPLPSKHCFKQREQSERSSWVVEYALWFILLPRWSQLLELNQGPWTTGQVATESKGGWLIISEQKGGVLLTVSQKQQWVNTKRFRTLVYVLAFHMGLLHLFLCSIHLSVTSSFAERIVPSKSKYRIMVLWFVPNHHVFGITAVHCRTAIASSCFPLLFSLSCFNMGLKNWFGTKCTFYQPTIFHFVYLLPTTVGFQF